MTTASCNTKITMVIDAQFVGISFEDKLMTNGLHVSSKLTSNSIEPHSIKNLITNCSFSFINKIH
jgi:hypothetical protein